MICLLAAVAMCSAGSATWSKLVALAHAKPSDIQISPSKWRGGGQYSLSTFSACWDDWQKLEPTTLNLGKELSGYHPASPRNFSPQQPEFWIRPSL